MTRLSVGSAAPSVTATTLLGASVTLPTPGRWTFLSFLRYASCPACNLRVRELRHRARDLDAAQVEWFAIFHSPDWRLKKHMPSDAWRHVIPDPDGGLASSYRTARSWVGLGLSMIVPSFYVAFAKTLAFGYWGGAVDRWWHTMPADFLIAPDGTIRWAHYGRHIVDHTHVDDLLALTVGP
jgi:peroxiredoxin Q/BCP